MGQPENSQIRRASELEDKCRSMCTDKKRYDKRVASLEKEARVL